MYFLGTFQALWPDRTVGEGIHACHFANLAVPYPFASQVHAFAAGTLITHLCGNASLCGELREQAGFVNSAGEGLLAIHVFACCQSFCTDDGVRVVGSAADNGVGLVQQFGIHLFVVVIHLHVGEELLILFEDALCVLEVHVAHADELDVVIDFALALVGYAVDVSVSATAYAYAEELNLSCLYVFLWGLSLAEHIGGMHCQSSCCCGSCLEEEPS